MSTCLNDPFLVLLPQSINIAYIHIWFNKGLFDSENILKERIHHSTPKEDVCETAFTQSCFLVLTALYLCIKNEKNWKPFFKSNLNKKVFWSTVSKVNNFPYGFLNFKILTTPNLTFWSSVHAYALFSHLAFTNYFWCNVKRLSA